jgi:predicted Rossmann-fold nucleotide-binding protein
MRILVCGGRDFGNLGQVMRQGTMSGPAFEKAKREYEFIHRKLNELARDGVDVVMTGGAAGVDIAAENWAAMNWIFCPVFKADWHAHGKAAGPIRNQKMIDEGKPDLVIAFPGGRGTADMVRRARVAKIKVIEIGE